MSNFAPVIIIVLIMLIQGLLQLSPGVFSIFYHSAQGKTNQKTADNLSLSFILGTETYLAIMLMSIFFVVSSLFIPVVDYIILFWTFAGLFFATAIVMAFFYFKKSKATALFISRKIAKNYRLRAENAKSRSDAFLLGFFSSIPELIFTLPLFVLLAFTTYLIPGLITYLVAIPYIIIAVIPLFVIRAEFRAHLNLAKITRLRTKLKPLLRFALTICYLALTATLIYLGVFYG